MAAMAVAAAADEVLRELPHISQTEATQYVTELRKMMKNWGQTFGGTDLMVERIYKAAPKAMPAGLARAANHEALRRHVSTLLETIIEEDDRFDMDWDSFGWDELRASIVKLQKKIANSPAQALQAVVGGGTPAPAQGQPGNQPGSSKMAGRKFVWGKERPAGFVDEVAQWILEDADTRGLSRKVFIDGREWAIVPVELPTKDQSQGGGQDAGRGVGYQGGTVETAAKSLGIVTAGVFSGGYTRVAEKFILDVFRNHGSVMEFVTMTFADLKNSEQAGRRIKWRELATNARTCDMTIKSYADAKKSQTELWADDVLELHAGSIAREDYTRRTGNYEGAEAISGTMDYLLPTEAITKAATYTNAIVKLRNNLRQGQSRDGGAQGAGWQGTGNGKGKSGSGTGEGFVPISERTCYECGAVGHIGRDCPQRKARLAASARDDKKPKSEK